MKNRWNLQNIKGIFLNNKGLKIGALIIAVIMWFVITNTSDPETQTQFTNIPVRFANMDVITDNGEVLTVLDDSDVVSMVTVRAPRSVVDQLTSDNIVASADVRNLKEDGTIPITYSTNRYYSQVASIKGSSDSVLVSVENNMAKNLQVKAQAIGDPESGYTVGDVTLDQNQIRISGPESIVKTIMKAEAYVDVSGATGSITTNVDVKILDSDGNDVDTSALTMNITSVKITAQILPVKNVPVTAEFSGSPADGYVLTGDVAVTPDTVNIAGRNSVISDIEQIEIPAEAVDITGASETVTVQIDITDYLPDNVRIVDSDAEGTITVTVGIEEIVSKEISVSMADVEVVHVPEGYTAQIITMSDDFGNAATASSQGGLLVTVSGRAKTLDTVSADNVGIEVDAEELVKASGTDSEDLSGLYTGEASIEAPDEVTVESGLRAVVRLTKDSDEKESEE